MSLDTAVVDGLTDEILKEEDALYYPEDYRKNRDASGAAKIIFSFLKNLTPNKDLHSIPAPTHLIKPKSMLEIAVDSQRPTPEILKVHLEDDPQKRMLLIAKHLMTAATDIPSTGMKAGKPYNPIAGEEFLCEYEHEDSVTKAIAEQVSHHPPITAAYLYNKKSNFFVHDVFLPRPQFLVTKFRITFDGETYIQILNHDERYDVSKCGVFGKGIFIGKTRNVLGGKLEIVCKKTGLRVSVNVDDNKVEGYMKEGKKKLYKFSGNFEKEIYLKSKQVDRADQKEELFMDCKYQNSIQKKVKPLEQQSPYESRRVWHSVTRHIWKDDHDEAGKAKVIIENHQRKIRKEKSKKKESPVLKHFRPTGKKGNGVELFEYKDLTTDQFTDENEDINEKLNELELD